MANRVSHLGEVASRRNDLSTHTGQRLSEEGCDLPALLLCTADDVLHLVGIGLCWVGVVLPVRAPVGVWERSHMDPFLLATQIPELVGTDVDQGAQVTMISMV